MKIITIIGTRPEIIRLSCVIKKLDEYYEHILVHTGQNWDKTLNDIFFEDLEIRKPDYYLNIVGENLGETMGNAISKTYKLLDELKPDAILILGDTNSALSSISAKRLKIPIFHMEAGNRCFDQNVPEEINRTIIDHISDINLCYTEHGRRNLIAEGLNPNHIIVTGSPLREVYNTYTKKINNSKIMEEMELKEKGYILWSTHREENIDKNWEKILLTINKVAEEYSNLKIIISLHPRTAKKINDKSDLKNNVIIHEPFGLLDFIKLEKNAYCIISDSGTISEEAAILNIPAINFRICTERPEATDKGIIIISGLEIDNLIQAIKITIDQNEEEKSYPIDYNDINVSNKIIKIIISYTHIINRIVWRKIF